MKYIILSVFVFFLTAGTVQAEVRIIANKSVGETTLSSSDIKDIFLGKKKKWPDTTRINIVVSDDANTHPDFLKNYIHRSSSQFRAYWKNMVFTGKGQFPTMLKTSSEVIDYVANTNGAIGYVDADSPAENVTIITVEQ